MRTAPAARIELTVPFHDVDMAGVVWHGNYARYLELARDRFMAAIGNDYAAMRRDGLLWPVVDLHVEYRHFMLHEQHICVEVRVQDADAYLTLAYTLRDAASDRLLARAQTRQVAVEVESRRLCLVLPPAFMARLHAWQAARGASS